MSTFALAMISVGMSVALMETNHSFWAVAFPYGWLGYALVAWLMKVVN